MPDKKLDSSQLSFSLTILQSQARAEEGDKMKKEILIVNGPNKFDFVFRLFYTEACERSYISFVVNDGDNDFPLALMISSIFWKDYTGERFFFEGSGGKNKVKGCYNTTTKAGYIEFV